MSFTEKPVLDFLQGLYRFQTLNELSERICQELTDLIGGENTIVCTHDGRQRVITSVTAAHPFSRANMMPHINENGMMALHPFWDSIFHPSHPVRSISDLVSRKDWHRNPLYNEVFFPDGIEDQINVEISGTPDAFTTVNVLRSSRGFSSAERTRFTLLGRHISQAFQNARLAESAGLVLATSPDGFHLRVLPSGEIIMPEGQDVRSRLKLLGREDGLPENLMRWVRHQCALLNQGCLQNRLRTICHKHGPQVWLLGLHRDFSENLYVLSVHKKQQAAQGVPLSPRELEVMRWVATGLLNGEIAEKLRVSEHTVKTYLKRSFQKLDARNRTEAVRNLQAQGRMGRLPKT